MDDLVELVESGDRLVPSGHVLRAVELVGEDVVEDVVDERRLARARHPGDRDEVAEREVDGDVLEVVLAGAGHGELAPVVTAPHVGHRDLATAGQVHAGERVGVLEQALDRAGVHDVAAVLAGAGADVDDPVGRGDGVLVVLDDDERVAEVAQPRQRLDEPVVVALVQADGGLVEDVEDADEARADLRREPDALRLAAGERARGTVEREVVEADVEQEAEPGVDLLDDPLGDLLLARREVDGVEEAGRIADGERTDLGDVLAADAARRATRA